LGRIYFNRKDYRRAEQAFERALELDPRLLPAYYQCALASIRNGKPEKGKQLLETFDRKRRLREPEPKPSPEVSGPVRQVSPQIP